MHVTLSSFVNNFGMRTNDLYAFTFFRLEFINNFWGQKIQNQINFELPSYSDRGKFLLINETEFEIRVEENSFDCEVPLDRSVIFSLNQNEKSLEPPLFNFKQPSSVKRSYLSHFDFEEQLSRKQYYLG